MTPHQEQIVRSMMPESGGLWTTAQWAQAIHAVIGIRYQRDHVGRVLHLPPGAPGRHEARLDRAAVPVTAELSARDRAILEFERLHWGHVGNKDTAALMLFGLTWAAYAQVLQTIVRRPEAEAYDAEHVRRLRRLNEDRRASRPARRVGYVTY